MSASYFNMTYSDVVEFAKKYFLMEESDVAETIKTKLTFGTDKYRLVAILGALEPWLDKYKDITEDDLKRKIGRVIFKKLNYSSFNEFESPSATRTRLYSLFEATTKKGINPYEILYVTVLTQGELFLNDYGYFDSDKARIGQFDIVFATLKNKLKLEDRKIVSMYERCSSLIYKVNTLKINNNFDTVRAFHLVRRIPYQNALGYKDENIYLFNESEVVEIFRNNPSLFTLTNNRIIEAYKYVAEKATNYILEHRKKGENYRKVDVMHDWILNNSSVLTIKVEEMKKKESALYNELSKYFSKEDTEEILSSLFNNPTNISYINKISAENFFGKVDNYQSNYQKVINLIVENLGEEQAKGYFKNVKTIYGVNSAKLEKLFINIKGLDALQGTNLFQKFISSGDAIVPYLETNKTEDVIEKLKTNKILEPVKLYNMTKREIAQEFYRVFAGKKAEQGFNELERLLNINYENECLIKSLNDIYKNIDMLAELFGVKEVDEYDRHIRASVPQIKNDIELQGKIVNLGDKILGLLHLYAGKVRDVYKKYEPDEIDLAMKKYEDDIKMLRQEADDYIAQNMVEAKKHYKNPEELAETFKANTADKIKLSSSPRQQIKGFVKKFGKDLLKPVTTSLMRMEEQVFQPSLFDFGLLQEEDSSYVCDVQFPSATDEKYAKFLKRIKKQYGEVAKIVKSLGNKDDEIIIR